MLPAQGYAEILAATNQSSGTADVVLDRNSSIFMPAGTFSTNIDGLRFPTRRNEVIFSGAGCAVLVRDFGNECVINATWTFIADYDVAAVAIFPSRGQTNVSADFLTHYVYKTGIVSDFDSSVIVEDVPPAFSITKVPLQPNSTYAVKLINTDDACLFSYSLTTYAPGSTGEHTAGRPDSTLSLLMQETCS